MMPISPGVLVVLSHLTISLSNIIFMYALSGDMMRCKRMIIDIVREYKYKTCL